VGKKTILRKSVRNINASYRQVWSLIVIFIHTWCRSCLLDKKMHIQRFPFSKVNCCNLKYRNAVVRPKVN